ncbi:MAG: enoyl-CoA hydratase/isomerase family protein [Acidimicrobiia bacterium]
MSIATERRNHTLIVTLDRPHARNAINLEMSRRLIETWHAFAADPELRVAVLTGTGDKAFCAGADLKEVGSWYSSMTSEERTRRAETEPGLGGITRNLDPGKPIIAAVNGSALAGGLELALACDLRIAAEGATFGLPEVRWGLMPGAGGTQRLPRLIPAAAAMEMMLSAQPIDAVTALRLGLVSRVVPRAELLDTALQMAGRIAANAPLAVQAARRAALEGRHLPLDEALQLENCIAEPLRQGEDVQEGLAAFAENRPPVFKGK